MAVTTIDKMSRSVDILEGKVILDGDNLLATDAEVTQNSGIEFFDTWEADSFGPEELYQFQLAKNANNLGRLVRH